MTIVISLVNMKGGVGKSTITANLASQYSAYPKWGKKVLVVDLDPQFNVSQYLLGADRYEKEIYGPGKPTIWDIFEQNTKVPGKGITKVVPNQVIKKVKDFNQAGRIDLIPSRLELAYTLKNPAQKEYLLSDFLTNVKSEYDIIIIDCPPTESLLTTSAYLSSDYILVPVKPEFLSMIGLPLLARSVRDFYSQYQKKVEVIGIVFNDTSNYSPEEVNSKNEVMQEATNQGWYVFTKEIKTSRSYPRGAREGKPIFSTTNAHNKVALQFHDFAEELALRIKL